jgi:hypothetical protein
MMRTTALRLSWHNWAAPRLLTLQVQLLEVKGPGDFQVAFERATTEHAEILFIEQTPLTDLHFRELTDLAARRRLPAIASTRSFTEAGLLMSYGVDYQGLGEAAGRLRRQDPERCQTRRPTRGAELQVRIGNQRQNRQGARSHDPALASAPRGPRDRIAMSLAADRRRALLTAALGFLALPAHTPALRALHAWLDNWRGLGLIVDAMRRQGYRVSLREIEAWVASFRHDPMVSVLGFGSAPTPWGAVQQAAWVVMKCG